MNIQHLRYAAEVEKTGSIRQAAENLLVAQPNLSKAIKELESNLGITIFAKTDKGMTATTRGEEFLIYAKQLLKQLARIEDAYQKTKGDRLSFGICTPGASYLTHAFTSFVNKVDPRQGIDIDYKETGTMEAINCIVNGEQEVAVIRYPQLYADYFSGLLCNRDIECHNLVEFEYQVLFSKEHPLAHKKMLALEELCGYIEIIYGDTNMPYLSVKENLRENGAHEDGKREIYVYQRGSQFALLSNISDSYMWAPPILKSALRREGLVQKPCAQADRKYQDVVIYQSNRRDEPLLQSFLREVNETTKELKR